MSMSSQRRSEPPTRYDRICTLHGKKISDEGDLCPAGHVALSYERRVRHEPLVTAGSERKVSSVPTPPRPPSSPHPTASQAAPGGASAAAPPALTKSQLMKPRRFSDDLGRVMVLRIKDTKANGWAVHCCLAEPQKDGKDKGKLKVVQQGLTRIHGADLEKCQREFFDLCSASEKAGWKDAPRGRKLMEIPKPNFR